MYRLSTDVGGTFTDAILFEELSGKIQVSKVSSTPRNPAIGAINSLDDFAISFEDISQLIHGTTIVINTLIQKAGVKTALITTKGFRDVLEIGRGNRTQMYDCLYKKPALLIPRRLILEAEERISAKGDILIPLDARNIDEVVAFLQEENVQSVAVCLFNAYCNPQHEKELGKLLNQLLPQASVTLSHLITRRYYEYERTSTAVQNAYVMPVVKDYLHELEGQLTKRGLHTSLQIMQSNGGVMSSHVASERPISMVESGPVAGSIGAAALGRYLGYLDLVTYDMGGTTAKVSIVREGSPEMMEQYQIEGRPIFLPVVDIREIGAGGGSIAWIDEAGGLHVGPQSAGAEPGPACYLRGGLEPTVTDANLHLGILDQNYFLGGEMKISADLSSKALSKIGHYFNISVDEAALEIITIVNTNMSGLLRSMTIERGYDPREFTLVSFGGAGPTHATAVAEELGIPRVIVPLYPGVFSAWGMVTADVRHDFSMTYINLLHDSEPQEINYLFEQLEYQIRELFEQERVPDENVTMLHTIDMRYFGQQHALSVEAPAPITESTKAILKARFDDLHYQLYSQNSPGEPKEIVSLNVAGIGKVTKPTLQAIPEGGEIPPASSLVGKREIYSGNSKRDSFAVYRREKLCSGNVLRGPAIIEEPTSTTVLGSDDHVCTVDAYGNLIIVRE